MGVDFVFWFSSGFCIFFTSLSAGTGGAHVRKRMIRNKGALRNKPVGVWPIGLKNIAGEGSIFRGDKKEGYILVLGVIKEGVVCKGQKISIKNIDIMTFYQRFSVKIIDILILKKSFSAGEIYLMILGQRFSAKNIYIINFYQRFLVK